MTQENEPQQVYLLIGSGSLAVSLVCIARLIRNAVQMRLCYQEMTFEGEAPPDPTANFLGEHWWSLPASLTASLAAIWAVMEWAKVSTLLTGGP